MHSQHTNAQATEPRAECRRQTFPRTDDELCTDFLAWSSTSSHPAMRAGAVAPNMSDVKTVQQQGRQRQNHRGARWAAHREKNMEVLDVEAGLDVKVIGMVVRSLPPRVLVVHSVSPGTWASDCGIKPGYVIIEVNGQTVEGMSGEYYKNAMKKRPVRVTLRRTLKRQSTPHSLRRTSM